MCPWRHIQIFIVVHLHAYPFPPCIAPSLYLVRQHHLAVALVQLHLPPNQFRGGIPPRWAELQHEHPVPCRVGLSAAAEKPHVVETQPPDTRQVETIAAWHLQRIGTAQGLLVAENHRSVPRHRQRRERPVVKSEGKRQGYLRLLKHKHRLMLLDINPHVLVHARGESIAIRLRHLTAAHPRQGCKVHNEHQQTSHDGIV